MNSNFSLPIEFHVIFANLYPFGDPPIVHPTEGFGEAANLNLRQENTVGRDKTLESKFYRP
jgi:hypothetical protein